MDIEEGSIVRDYETARVKRGLEALSYNSVLIRLSMDQLKALRGALEVAIEAAIASPVESKE